uniref:GPI transamidase component PIG-S-like n=1 Tax=Actinia tenebrosa TaxID=6105 RepID=A0A6P8J182_ACTTE
MIGFIFIIIGLPLWWNTTKVYRASLPYKDIEKLAELKLDYLVNIKILIPKEESLLNLKSFDNSLRDQLNSLIAEFAVNPKFEINTRFLSEAENSLLKEKSQRNAALKDLDFALQKLWYGEKSSNGNYIFIFLPSGIFEQMKTTHIGKFLHTIIPYKKEIASELKNIVTVIKNVYINVETISRAFNTASQRNLKTNNMENIRAQKSVSGYQISFTLLNSDPDSVIPWWNIEEAVQKYLNPFLAKVPHLNTSIDSQVLHYSTVQLNPTRDGQAFYLDYKDLPHLINPIEAKLGSYVSLNSNLNFIVYVPSQDQTPLYVRNKDGDVAESNAFLSPQWGGFVIYNINRTNLENNHVELEMRSVMSTFISQLKLLLGGQPIDQPEQSILGEYSSTEITEWEELSLWRTKTMEFLSTSTITLTSLARLLEQISNMVIGDQIQKQIQQALLSIEKSKDALEQGRVTTAYLEAKTALTSSENAFFDPSILALLYFPDDQKYAIYIPLFLPISIPIILSLFEGIKWLKGSKDKSKTDEREKKPIEEKKND